MLFRLLNSFDHGHGVIPLRDHEIMLGDDPEKLQAIHDR